MQCDDTSFRINTGTSATYTKGQIGSNCNEDYIGIEGLFVKVVEGCFEKMFVS